MIVRLHYTTCEGGCWNEFFTDTVKEARIKAYLLSLSVPLRHHFTILSPSLTDKKETILVNSFRFKDGMIWDAIHGVRQSPAEISSAYDEVWKLENKENL